MMRSDFIDIREAHRLNKEREHFLSGAATPPNLGGEFGLTFRYMTYLWAKRELEDIDALLLTKSSGKCPNSSRGLQPASIIDYRK